MKRIYFFVGLLSTIIICFAFVINPRDISASEKVRLNLEKLDQSIQDEIENHTLLSLSSNPYDYITENEYYDVIIELGVAALCELENSLVSSDENGLVQYIISIAIEDISHTNVNEILGNEDFGWEDAHEFTTEWLEIKDTVTENVETIIQSELLNDEEKIEKINHYGLLAVPTIESYVHAAEGRQSNFLKAGLKHVVESYNLDEKEIELVYELF